MAKSSPGGTSHRALPEDHLYRLVLAEAQRAIDAAGRRAHLALTAATAAQRVFAESPADFAALLREHGIRQPRRGANAQLPLVHLLFGSKRAPRTKSRYASMLEHLQAHGVSEIAAFLRRPGGIDAVLRGRGRSRNAGDSPAAPWPAYAQADSLVYPALALAIAHQIETQQAIAGEPASVAAIDPDAPFAFTQILAGRSASADLLPFGAAIDDGDDTAIGNDAVTIAMSDHAVAIVGQPGGEDPAIDFSGLG